MPRPLGNQLNGWFENFDANLFRRLVWRGTDGKIAASQFCPCVNLAAFVGFWLNARRF
jgi:hypothetical protein